MPSQMLRMAAAPCGALPSTTAVQFGGEERPDVKRSRAVLRHGASTTAVQFGGEERGAGDVAHLPT